MEYRSVFVKSTISSLNSYMLLPSSFISNFMSHKKFDLLLLIHKMRKCEIWFGPSGFLRAYLIFFSFCRRMELEK